MKNSHPMLVWSAAVALVLATGCGQSANRTQSSPSDATSGSYTTDNVQVAQVELGRNVDADKRVTDKTESFKPNDTIYASVVTNGAASGAELKVRWTFEDGQVVHESTEMISPTGNAATAFHISKPEGFPPGKYTVEVFVNGAPTRTQTFVVERS
jgi:hypothetical protein